MDPLNSPTDHDHGHDHEHHHLSFPKFFLAIGSQLAAVIILFAWIFPHEFSQEVAQPWRVLGWTFAIGLPLSLFEYLYHRYLLHSAVLPFMGAMHDAHQNHHGLTYVKAPVTPKEPAKLVAVKSEFPIEEAHQEESMMFPLWSYPIFMFTFMVLIATPLKLIFPSQPVFLALIFSVTAFYMAYEIWHAVLHLPFDTVWKPLMEGRFTGPLTRRVYGFHLMHHWRPTSNLAIVGFWGVAVWDYALRTHRRPDRLPLDGAEVNYNDAKLAKPLWPISLMDRWQPGMYKASRATERFLARVFLRRKVAK